MGNYLKELIKKGNNSNTVTEEFNVQEYGNLRINSDKKSTIICLSAPESSSTVMTAVDIPTDEFKRVLETIKQFTGYSTTRNQSLEIDKIGGEDVNIKIIRYGVDITQIIVKFGNISGFQLISDTEKIYSVTSSLKSKYKF